MKKDSKTIYAQSSDIKSRTYLEFRKDMKQKAIAELETIDWLAKKLTELYVEKTTVRKTGGDAFVWFLKKSGITGEPDFEAEHKGIIEKFEFQYANNDELDFFDFKVSKVGKKVGGKRIPFADRKFIYIIKSTLQYAILETDWIMQNGKEAGVPAWGNRTAFRVPNEKFKQILKVDKNLKPLVENIDQKIDLLNFQNEFIKLEEQKLSDLLQTVTDKNAIVRFIPKDLDSFYKVCFIIDRLNEIPVNANLWLVYVLSFYDDNLNSYQMAQLIYCIDFLYSKIDLENNELERVVETIQKIKNYCEIKQKNNGKIETSVDLSPIEEIRNFLFTVNLLEDLIQDSIFYYRTNFKPIEKIFETVRNISTLIEIIKQ
ncbi:MAG: hypothetical protein FWC41_09850 [Firmicutes bacterium]|nr:hypothetical protein [Bacillota bacterium]